MEDGNRAKPRKPADRNSWKPDSRGLDTVTQRASASDDSHLSLKSSQQEFSMSSLHQKRNRRQWLLFCGNLGPHENPVVSEMQPSTLNGVGGDGLGRCQVTRSCVPVNNSIQNKLPLQYVFAVSVDVNGIAIEAVVNTGAEVSVPLKLISGYTPHVIILQADEDSKLEGYMAGPCDIHIRM